MEELEMFIKPEIYQKLIESSINTTLNFLISNTNDLSKITELSEEEIEEIKLNVSKIIHKPNKIVKAVDLAPWKRISTGCKSIDSILRNGIAVGHITELFGCSGVGKTQICLQLALQVQLPIDFGGLEKGTVYICTEDIFPSKRLHQLANFYKIKHKLPEKDFESAIFLKHAQDIAQLQKCLSLELPCLFRKENIGLIVIDSIAGPFRGENENEYLLRSKDLTEIAYTLNNICVEYNVAIVCTNQVSDDIVKCTTEPCLGIAWSNFIHYRCQILRYNDSSLREFEIIFSPDVANRKINFAITENGLECKEFL